MGFFNFKTINIMNTITVNGRTINSSGNVVVSSNRIMVNGVDVTPDTKEINITITGATKKIEVDYCNKITVNGDVENLSTMSGDVDVTGNVNGSLSTMSGNVDCGDIGGTVSTMSGNIKHKK
jgi:hypothetical protein